MGRAISIILILLLAGGSGSPVFARSLGSGLAVLQGQLTRLSRFAPALAISKPRGAAQSVIENHGMPPNPPSSVALRPEPPQSRSVREARVARLVLNVRGAVTLAPGESIQLNAVPEDEEGNTVHGLTAEWQSLNSQTVAVTTQGEAKAMTAGVAPLIATIGLKTASLLMTVVPKASASGNTEHPSTGARELAGRSQRHSQQSSRNPSWLFAHSSSSAVATPPLPIGIGDAEQLYKPANAVGAPPGKTTPGASRPGAAIESTETPGSANFTFDLGVVSLPGRGLDLDFGLSYNSRIWTKSLGSPTQMTYNMDAGWIAPGFVAGYGYLDDQSDGSAKQFMIRDPNGTRHRMVNVPVGSNSYQSDDGTFVTLTVNGAQVMPAVATYPGGVQIRYGVGDTSVVTRYYPTQIADRNGNFIAIAYAGDSGRGPKIDSVQDTLGRYVRFKYAGNDLIAVTAPGLTGQADRPVMRFYYDNISGLNQPGLFQSGIVVNAPPGGTAHVIKYIYLPNATEAANAHIGYRYDYSSYGMMYKITQFRGMTISTAANDYTQAGTVTNDGTLAAQTTYNYHGTPDNPTTGISDAPFYTTRTDDWAGRTSAQPVYSFSVNQGSGLSTVTAPDGTITETHSTVSGGWDNGLINQTTIKIGSTVLSDTVFSWEPSAPGNIPRLSQVKTTNEAVPAQTKAVVFTYDPTTTYNNISKVSERDLTTNGSVSPVELRRTETTYVTDGSFTNRGLISLPSIVKVFAGGSTNPISRTDYSYDEFSLAAAPAIIMYTDPGTTVRGNLTRTRTYPDVTNLANFIDHTATYDIAGNTLTAQLDCCQQKSFTYSSAYFYAYVTSITSGSGPTLPTSATYDLNTGLAGVVTDENSQQTSFFYNADSLRPEHVDYADGGRVSYTYNDALSSNASGGHYYSCTTTRLDATHSVQSYSFYDGRGAVAQTFDNWTSLNGWSTQDVEYDVMGRAYRAGNPYYSSGYSPGNPINPTGFWTTRTFDNLGRVKIVTMPSGDASPSSTTTVQTDYAGTVTTVTDQSGKQRRQITDGLGRVVRLHEPDANGSLGAVGAPAQETTYEYDTLDNLIHITQGAQQRYFKYDSLSRLTYERQVEQDTPFTTTDSVAGNNQWSRKLIYNSNGLVTDAYDARQINTHISYDGLNRVSLVTYSDSTPAVNYTYDQARSGFFNQGRLTTVTTAAAGQTPSTTNEFDYERVGRVAGQRQKIGTATYPLSYGYNLAGLLLSERYPSGRSVNYGYDEGARLATVTDSAGVPYASGFTYAPHGGLSSETFGNAAVHTLAYNSRLQASQIKLKQSATGPELQRFDYAYGQATQSTGAVDVTRNNGQIGRVDSFTDGTKQWDQRFTYDSLGRLSLAAEFRGDNAQLTWQTHYDYDRYGNRFQYQQNVGVGYTTVLPGDVDANRNRFISSGATPTTYDPAGNILTDTKFRGLSYIYDANNRQTSASGTGVSQTAVYDAMGQRVQTSASGAARQMVYDAFGQIVAEYGGGSLRRENVYRGGQLLASQEFSTPAPPTRNVTWTPIRFSAPCQGRLASLHKPE